MRGTIARRSVVHDVEADWVLAHHYIRIHEVSREKNTEGQPEYEAMVFIGWNNRDTTPAPGLTFLAGYLPCRSVWLSPARTNFHSCLEMRKEKST